jgi:hypothetical protein
LNYTVYSDQKNAVWQSIYGENVFGAAFKKISLSELCRVNQDAVFDKVSELSELV